jgi:hypothetical protein
MAERRGHPGLTADRGSGRISRSGVPAGLATAALILAVSGCSGAPGPTPSTHGTPGTVLTASPTPSTTPSTTRTVPAPERPAAMDRADADGAIAAATYFISLYPYAYATGDLAAWTAMSDPACAFCRSVVGHVTEMRSLGHTSQGPSISVSSVQNGPTANPGSFAIEMHVKQGPSIERDAAGAVVDRVDESKTLFLVVALEHDRAGWIVRETSTHGAGTRG